MAPAKLPAHEQLAKLAAEGPVKQEPANRRVRGLLGGAWVFDSLGVEYVWEHKYYPMYYVPLAALDAGAGTVSKGEAEDGKGFWIGTLKSGNQAVEIAGFVSGPLNGLVKIAVSGLDAWFTEDEKIVGPHPKNPYTRVECLPSSRSVRIEVDGTVVAESTNNIFLHETLLRTRYYLPPTAVLDQSVLTPSETTSFCPYKGQASYYHLKVGEREIKDAVWYYVFPTVESAAIVGRLCFYNEKVDIFIDGVKEER